MTYPSIEDKVFNYLYLKDCNDNEYPFDNGDFHVPEGIAIETAHVCFPNELSEKIYATNSSGDYGSNDLACTGGSSYNTDLVLALCRPLLLQRIKSIIRTKRLMPLCDFKQAIMHAGLRCERCMNSLAYAYGLDWGYKAFSNDWERCGTKCDACRGVYSEAEIMQEALE